MVGRLDVTCMDLNTFMRKAYQGVPQTLEAMFAPDSAVLVDHISALRHQFYGPLPEMRDMYRRAIKNMSGEDDTQKRKFHALRLAYNFSQAERTGGRFNPRLPQEKIDEFRYWSSLDYGSYLTALEDQADQLF